jgi:hypothetical protein
MNTPTATAPRPVSLELEYPLSLERFARYDDAQRVVDYLCDAGFPVNNVQIVGTGLTSVERVTGRLTRKGVAAAGALSGVWLGMFVGLAFALFSTQGHLGFLIATPLIGALFGLIWSQLGFTTMTRNGARDFASVSQFVATNYEVVVEHNYAAQAHAVLATMPAANVRW